MSTDKTDAPTTVTAGHQTYTVAVDGKTVGHADYADRGDQRVFYHTVVDPDFGGRGLATILIEEALDAARADGKRIVRCVPWSARCSKSIPNSTTSPTPSPPTSSTGYGPSRPAELSGAGQRHSRSTICALSFCNSSRRKFIGVMAGTSPPAITARVIGVSTWNSVSTSSSLSTSSADRESASVRDSMRSLRSRRQRSATRRR